MTLEEFNKLDQESAQAQLTSCLGCKSWASAVAQQRPFESVSALTECGANRWQAASEPELLEAFSAHPQIGDLEALRNKYANTASAEQGQITEAAEVTLRSLQQQNAAYLKKFGFIFIVCATGKSAAEMLELLNARLPNDRSTELANGAREQWQITLLRLDKLFSSQ